MRYKYVYYTCPTNSKYSDIVLELFDRVVEALKSTERVWLYAIYINAYGTIINGFPLTPQSKTSIPSTVFTFNKLVTEVDPTLQSRIRIAISTIQIDMTTRTISCFKSIITESTCSIQDVTNITFTARECGFRYYVIN